MRIGSRYHMDFTVHGEDIPIDSGSVAPWRHTSQYRCD